MTIYIRYVTLIKKSLISIAERCNFRQKCVRNINRILKLFSSLVYNYIARRVDDREAALSLLITELRAPLLSLQK